MIQSLFIMSTSGEVMIEKHWRGRTKRSVCDFFWEEVCKCASKDHVAPVMQHGNTFLISVYREQIFIIACVEQETPPLLVIEFLHRVLDIFAEYFGTVDEIAIKDNFSLVYQLLEEMMDNGYPLTTESNALKAMIAPPSVINRIAAVATGKSGISDELPDGTISSIPWRNAAVKYSQNEIYLDIVEEIDAIIAPSGQIISSSVSGAIMAQSRLSGIPDLILTFTADPSILDDCSFHPCVRYNRFERDRVLSFVPPDGSFELMKYRIARVGVGQGQVNVAPPVYCNPTISIKDDSGGGSRSGHVSINIGVKPTSDLIVNSKKGGEVSLVEDVVVTVQFPRSVQTANLSGTTGSVLFDEANKVAKWTVSKLARDKMQRLTGSLVLQSRSSEGMAEEIPPIQMAWHVPQSSVSGLSIGNLKPSLYMITTKPADSLFAPPTHISAVFVGNSAF
ncbi:unnamed protein product [Chrysoparadoxa australica]